MSEEKRIQLGGMSMCRAEALDYKIRIAKIEVQQLFCEHVHTTRMFIEQSSERITCNDCGKVWYD